MSATLLPWSLLLVWLCAMAVVCGQVPYSGMGDEATQYQHRWTDELEWAMINQQTHAERQQQQQQQRNTFTTQQSTLSPSVNAITDARQPHSFTPIPATATGPQQAPPPSTCDTSQPRVSIPLSNIVIGSLPLSDNSFDTASADTEDEQFDTHGFPLFNDTVIRRARAACSLSCSEGIMDVAGEGRVRINSSRAVIRATIEFKEQLTVALLASSATAPALHTLLLSASNQTAITAAAVINYLHSGELKGRVWQLHTTSTLVEPIYQYVNGTQLTNGYRASLSFSLQASTTNASGILTGMLERGVTRIDSVGYEAADADTAKARQRAVQKAVEDALQQATTGVQAVRSNLYKRAAAEHKQQGSSEADKAEDRGGLQVISMRVTGVSVPSAQMFYPSQQTRIFGLTSAVNRLFVDASVMSIPIIAEEKVISATVQMKLRF